MENEKEKNQKITVTDKDIKNAKNIVEAAGLFAKLIKIVVGIFKKN